MFRTVEFETADGIAVEKIDAVAEFSDDGKKVLLKNEQNTLEMTVNRRIVKLNGIKVWLTLPLKADVNGDWRISRVDFDKIITPLFLNKFQLSRDVKKIVVDAGHGGDDTGAVGKKYNEKDLNLALAFKIKSALEAKGFEVILSRDRDIFLTLDKRSEFAAEKQADIFLCIHHNAARGVPAAHGIETYSLTFGGCAGTHDSGRNATAKHERAGNKFDTENILLNYLVQSEVIGATGAFDRGVKFARYKVLVQAPCPAILFEGGFVSNTKEEEMINSAEHQTKAASAIAEAVAKFARLTAPQK